jgi:hypothetical protein
MFASLNYGRFSFILIEIGILRSDPIKSYTMVKHGADVFESRLSWCLKKLIMMPTIREARVQRLKIFDGMANIR